MPQPLAASYTDAAPFQLADFNALIPRAIEFTENLMYRDPDLDFPNTTDVDNSASFTAGNRLLTIPGNIIIVEQLAAWTPVGSTSANGTRVQYWPASLDVINQAWPQQSQTAAPNPNGPGPYFYMISDTQVAVAPTPDQNYAAEFTGVIRPAPLAQSATATDYLTNKYPDLYLAASMIFWAGVMKDYGQASDDPRLAVSWESVYRNQKSGAVAETARQMAMAAGWTSQTNAPLATPSRS